MIKEGILNFYKPSGISSNDAIYMLRRASGIKKIGHMGTLDPLAEGVLLLSVGRASKIMEYMELEYKSYECTMILGLESDSLDTEGRVLSDERESLVFPGAERAEEVLSSFKGCSMQYPPIYSSVRVAGRHLYDYARSGQDVEIKPRRIYIEDIELKGLNEAEKTLSFSVSCSKGTYIRALCRDIGRALGSSGCMSRLVRSKSGPFLLENSVTPEEIASLSELSAEQREDKLNLMLTDPDKALPYFGSAEMKERDAKYFCNGNEIWLSKIKLDEKKLNAPFVDVKFDYVNTYKIYSIIGGMRAFIGMGLLDEEEGRMRPSKIFYRGFSQDEGI